MRRFRSKRVSLRRPRKGRYGRSRRTRARKFTSGRYYKLVSTINTGTFSVNCNSYSNNAFTVQANMVPDHAHLKQLFDEYKIVRATIKFVPAVTSALAAQITGPAAGPTYTGLGTITSCIDYNDNNPPASQQEVLDNRTRRMTRSNRIHSRTFAPKPQATIYNGLTSAYAPRNAWIPNQYDTVPHYGLKAWLEGGSGDTSIYSFTAKCIVTLTILYRAPR